MRTAPLLLLATVAFGGEPDGPETGDDCPPGTYEDCYDVTVVTERLVCIYGFGNEPDCWIDVRTEILEMCTCEEFEGPPTSPDPGESEDEGTPGP